MSVIQHHIRKERVVMRAKHGIPFLLVALVLVGCKDDGPTVPAVGPQFAKPNCAEDPTHPSCKDDGGDVEDYIATDLETRRGRSGPSWAFEVSDDPGNGTVAVVGGTLVGNQYYKAVTWTVTGTDDVVGPNFLELDDPEEQYPDAFAFGISDNGEYVVGRARGTDSWPDWDRVLPVRWTGGSGEFLAPVGDYPKAQALDVNDDGQTVGLSQGDQPSVATLWDADGNPTSLGSPLGGTSSARAINNQGDVIGDSWDPVAGQWHAILWPAAGGRVLVAGDTGGPEGFQPTVWLVEVGVTPCVLDSWIVGSGPATSAFDVRWVDGGWEAVGIDDSGAEQRALVWHLDGSEITETQLARKDGRALGINSSGQIVGEVQVGNEDHATLWTPNPVQ
jgi:uncharacterized membrane protein